MSDSIEKRSLELEFKHKQFEIAVSKALTSLDKLNKSLNMQEAKRGLEEFTKVSDRFDLSGVSKALEKVESRFESFGYRLKVNVFDKIIRYSENMAKSIMITPISTGYSEYGLLLDSIRTIKASSGESVEIIQGYLDELNEYSDKTIYSFSDMTRNIGKFTNAGVKLPNATKAIQGVANAAALAGATTSEAEHSMYNFAQALSQGYVRYIDWKSIVIANMATVEFKQQLIDTASELGTIKKIGDNLWKTTKREITATKGFEESLSDAWLTSDVLIKTLEKYADESTDIGKKAYEAAGEVTTFTKMLQVLQETSQSGWALSWRYIFGDYDESKVFFTDLTKIFSDIINKQADSRNLALKEWKELGGREKLLKSIRYILTGIQAVVRSVSIGWKNVFGKVGGKQLLSWTEMLEKGSRKLQDFFIVESVDEYGNVTTAWTQNGLKLINISQGIVSIFGILIGLMKEMGVASVIFFKPMLKKVMPNWMFSLIPILKLTGLLKPFLGMLYDLTTITGLFFQNLYVYLKKNKTFQSIFSKFKDAWEPIRLEIEKAMNSFVLFYSSMLLGDNSLERVSNLFGNLLKIMIPVGQIFGVALGYAKKFFGYFFEEIKNSKILQDFRNNLNSFLSSIGNFFTNIYDTLAGNPLSDEEIAESARNTWEKISKFFTQFLNKISEWKNKISSFFVELSPNIQKVFDSIWTTIKMIFSRVKEIIIQFFSSFKLDDKIKGAYDSVYEALKEKSKIILNSVGNFFDNIKKYFEKNPLDKEALSKNFSNIWTFFQSVWNVVQKTGPIFGYIIAVVKEFIKAFVEFGKSSGLFDLVVGIFTTFGQAIGSLFDNISKYVVEHPIDVSKIKGAAQTFVNDLITLLLSPIEGLKNIGGKVWKSISDFLLKIFVPTAAAEELFSGTKQEITKVEENGYDFIDWISERFGHIKNKLTDFFANQEAWISTLPSYIIAISRLLFTGGVVFEFASIAKAIRGVIEEVKGIAKTITEFKQGYYKVELNKSRALKFVASMFLIATMAGSIYALASIEDPNKMFNAVAALTAFYVVYSILERLPSKNKLNSSVEIGKGLYNLAATILMLIVSLGAVAGAVYLLNRVDVTQFTRGEKNLKWLATTFIGFVLITTLLSNLIDRVSLKGTGHFTGKEFLWVSLSVMTFVGILYFLRQYKFGDFAESFKIIGALSFGMTILVALLGLANKFAGPLPSKGVKGLLSIAGAITLLIGPILTLNLLGKNVWRPVLAVVALIVSLGIALAAMSKIRNPLAGSIGVVAIMASIYILLNQITNMATNGVDLKEVSNLINSITTFLVGLGIALGGLTLAMLPIKGILTTLSNIVKSMSTLSPAGLGKGLLGALGVEALVWVGGKVIGSLLSDFIDKLYTFVGKLGFMSTRLENVNVKNFETLITVTEKVSEFVGLIPEVKELNKVDAFKTALSRIGVGLMLSSWGFKVTDSSSVQTACGLIKDHIVPAMKSIETINPDFKYDEAAASFTAIGSAFDLYGQFVKRATGNLGEASGTKIVDDTGKATYNVEEFGKFLNDIASLIPDDEVMKSIARFANKKGEKAPGTLLSSWAVGINSIAQAVNNMGVQTEDVDFEAVGNAVNLLGKLKEINNAITRLKFSYGFQTMVDQIGGMTKVGTSISFGVDLSPFIDGLEGFGMDIASLGNSFNAFGLAVSDTTIDKEKVEHAMSILEQLRIFGERLNTNYGLIGATAEYANELTVDGNKRTHNVQASASINFPWLDALLNDNKFERFAGGIADLGIGFHDFADSVSTFVDESGNLRNPEEVLGSAENATGILGALGQLSKELNTTGGLVKLWTGEVKLDQFAKDIGSLGTNLNTFATETAKIKWEDSRFETHIKPFFDYFKDIASDGSWFTGIAGFSSGLSTLALSMRDFISDFDTYFAIDNKTIIDQQMDHMVEGVRDYLAHMKEAFSGSDDTISQVSKFNDALNRLQTLLTTEIETQPVITPVLDLTQITSDVDTLNGLITPDKMFRVRAINSNTQASDLQSRMFMANGNIIINDDHSDVVSAVNKLGPKIDRLNTSLSNMKIVMNTGVLAGELTGPINKNLGKMASRGQGGS